MPWGAGPWQIVRQESLALSLMMKRMTKRRIHTDHFWKSTHAVIAIGSDIVTHQITGVATGEADTDVVNVGQMNQAVASEVVPLSDSMDNKINK